MDNARYKKAEFLHSDLSRGSFLEAFVAPFNPARLTAPGSPRMFCRINEPINT